jgi:hypothetical protein
VDGETKRALDEIRRRERRSFSDVARLLVEWAADQYNRAGNLPDLLEMSIPAKPDSRK